MKVALALVLAVLSMASMSADAAHGTQVGQWKKNLVESINMPEPDYQEAFLIRRADSVLDFTWTGVATDGTKSTFSCAGKVDGKAGQWPGGMGIIATMMLTADGTTRSMLKYQDGSIEDRMCILITCDSMTCYATLTSSSGKTSIFKEVFDWLPRPRAATSLTVSLNY